MNFFLMLFPIVVALAEGIIFRYLIVYFINKHTNAGLKPKLYPVIFHPIHFVLFIIYPAISYYLWIDNTTVWYFLIAITLIVVFISMSIIDWYIYKLPNFLTMLAVVLILTNIVNSNMGWSNALYGFFIALIIGFLIFGIGYMKYKKTVFGMGDVKLLAIIGLISGIKDFQFVFLGGTVLATAYAMLGIGAGIFTLRSKLPFGTFLCISVIIYILI